MLSQTFAKWLYTKWAIGPAAPPAKELLFAYDNISPLVIHDLIDKFMLVYSSVPNDLTAMARHVGRCDVIQSILEMQDVARSPQKYKTEVISHGSSDPRQ